jgi:hypothetical protein
MSDLSVVRNAARDMVQDMVRFERDFARFQRVVKAAQESGATDAAVTRAVNEAVAGHPDLQAKLLQFTAAMSRDADAYNARRA